MADEARQVTDPKALRALAHPLRWKLLDIVGREGTATATQCAQETGESVASCSYHLNMLAKYAFVEQAGGGQGREKPWRWVDQGRKVGFGAAVVDIDAELAAQAAWGAFLDHQLALIKERHLVAHLEPPEWRDAAGADQSNYFLTPDEVRELRETVRDLTSRFRDRRTNPDLRPAGARPVNIFVSITVTPDKS